MLSLGMHDRTNESSVLQRHSRHAGEHQTGEEVREAYLGKMNDNSSYSGTGENVRTDLVVD